MPRSVSICRVKLPALPHKPFQGQYKIPALLHKLQVFQGWYVLVTTDNQCYYINCQTVPDKVQSGPSSHLVFGRLQWPYGDSIILGWLVLEVPLCIFCVTVSGLHSSKNASKDIRLLESAKQSSAGSQRQREKDYYVSHWAVLPLSPSLCLLVMVIVDACVPVCLPDCLTVCLCLY